MRSKIFTLVLAPALLAAVAFTSHTAQAETRLNVPFNFTAAGKACPAGVYTVRRDSNSDYVMLTSKETRRTFMWLITPGPSDPTGNRVVLRFDESGHNHTLRSIQYGSMVTSRLDGKSAGGGRVLSVTESGQ